MPRSTWPQPPHAGPPTPASPGPSPFLAGELESLEQLPVLLHQVREIRGREQPDGDLRLALVFLEAGGEGEDGAGEVVGVAGEGQHLVGGAVVGEDEVPGAGAVGVHPSWVDPNGSGLIWRTP